jgi:hypothetical protein
MLFCHSGENENGRVSEERTMRTGSLAAALFVAAPALAATPEHVAGDLPPAATTVAAGEDLSRRMTVPVTVNMNVLHIQVGFLLHHLFDSELR